jgi:acyl transferase
MVREHKQEIFTIKKRNGDIIHAVYNYIDKSNPLIVISPPLEKDIRSILVLMVYLINNGFNVFRYDHTYHNGNSTGKIADWTLSSGLSDMEEVVDFIKNEDSISTQGGFSFIGMSISSRVGFRYLAQNNGAMDSFLSIVGVINMQHTIKGILDFDLINEFVANPGKVWGVRKVLHYPISWDKYCQDCIDNQFHNLETTIEDIKKINTPLSIIVAEDDQWVDINEYHQAFSENPGILKFLLKIPGAGHELYKNPSAAKSAFLETVKIFSETYYNKKLADDGIITPNISEIIELNKEERKREKKYELV